MVKHLLPSTVFCTICSGTGTWQECTIVNSLLPQLKKLISNDAAFSECECPEYLLSKIIVGNLKSHLDNGTTPPCVKDFLSDCISDDNAIDNVTKWCHPCNCIFTIYTHLDTTRTVYSSSAGPFSVCIVDMIKYFVRKLRKNGGPTIDMSYSYLFSYEMSSLVVASRKGDITKVRTLTQLQDQKGQLVCVPSKCYFEALYNAVYYGKMEVVKYFLHEHKPLYRPATVEDFNILTSAAYRNSHHEILSYLIENY